MTQIILLIILLVVAIFVIRRNGGFAGTYRAWRQLRGRFLQNPRVAILFRFGRLIGLGMLAIFGIYFFIVKLLIGGTLLFQPHSANGVLNVVQTPSYYVWTAEARHEFPAGGQTVRQDMYSLVAVDTSLNRFQAGIEGVFPSALAFTSDGYVTLRNDYRSQQQGRPWQEVTNPCRHQPALSATLATMPSAAEIKAEHPKLVSSNSNVSGVGAWELSFTPTAQIIRQLLLVPLLDAGTTSGERVWVLSPSERAALNAGQFKVLDANAWVKKSSPRQLIQVHVKISFDHGRVYELLAAVRPSTKVANLADLNLGKATCTK